MYNKLVRDKILNIIKNNNQNYTYHIADLEEYKTKLLDKLTEEVNEFKVDKNEEEIADILEIIDAIILTYNLSIENIYNIKNFKAENKGNFKNKIILESTFD
ncbi:nucleoside triphosphate pyrophosphohydrolase [uncultured Cetobacterium sp.]|uniref:nucleoside triphosphate pyrophosphohydrolase n=1 Tax=uncultured Cetobacterium sp. TaxID=527638 RepID=UPI002608A512|nr:nucleoside triphosphate pyrophosphohydrolase [uncultured Cetobacterium sp.]